jgi:hypothetical protein
MEGTCLLLSLLWEAEYKVSRKKAPDLPKHCQIPWLSPVPGQYRFSPERKQAVCSIPAPKTSQQIRGVLGATGFCRIWTSNYSLLDKPLYETIKG